MISNGFRTVGVGFVCVTYDPVGSSMETGDNLRNASVGCPRRIGIGLHTCLALPTIVGPSY
jgi:hypothetical protein